MYQRYATEERGWRFEVMEYNESELGGAKSAIASITSMERYDDSSDDNNSSNSNALGVYGALKYESGVHRVQRVPATETAGRLHTSAATVAVLPDIDSDDEKFALNPADIRVDVMRSSGPGGQHVNKTESAVRMVHIPTGLEVRIQDDRSQGKNKVKALKVLTARVYQHYISAQQAEVNELRTKMIGTGDRSERIRTYNYPQNRITDHRCHVSLNGIDRMLAGELLNDLSQSLKQYFREIQIAELDNQQQPDADDKNQASKRATRKVAS
jgi:peptide chain release factor 1